jgi:hypothetical protein
MYVVHVYHLYNMHVGIKINIKKICKFVYGILLFFYQSDITPDILDIYVVILPMKNIQY